MSAAADPRSVTRLEDERLLAGRGRFHRNIALPGAASAVFVRSRVAHGRIVGIDAARALALPGVLGVFTSADLPPGLVPARQPMPGMDFTPYLQPPLADGWVRHEGQPVAVVVGTDEFAASDAAALVEVTVEPLPVVLDARSAVGDRIVSLAGAPALVGTVTTEHGDLERVFAAAPHVVECELAIGRHTGMPLETRGLTVAYDSPSDRLTVWGLTKVPFWNRSRIARFLGMRDDQVRAVPGDVGGSFGIRGELYAEDLVVAWVARRLETVVRWHETREEHLLAANHAREQAHVVRGAFDDDGILLGLDDEAWLNTGAYIRTHGAVVAALTSGMFGGPYRMQALRSRVHIVTTNTMSVGTYRGPGRFQNNYVREHLLDVAAGRLGITPIEIRERNLLDRTELPGERPIRLFGAPMLLDGADHRGHFADAACEIGADSWYERARRERREGRLVGVGVAAILEKAGLGHENATVRVDSGGHIVVEVGSTSVGQGAETVMASIAADVLGVDHTAVTVVLSDTASLHDGGGTFASRSTVIGGSAVHDAAVILRGRILEVAADLLGVPADALLLRQGAVTDERDPARTAALADIAQAAVSPRFARTGTEPGLIGRATFAAPTMTYPYGTHWALVEVNPGSGVVRILRYAVTYEIGRAVHPAMAVGQIVGGVAQGIGGALFEEIRYDPSGRLQTRSLDDYRLPTARDVPEVEVHLLEEAPAPGNPLGVRGVGEAGITGVGAAVANAVRDALQLTGPVPRLPLTPDAVLDLLDRAGITPEEAP